MDIAQFVHDRVHHAYWDHDWNCAVTTLRILAEVFDVTLEPQVLDAALGMHGAGGYRGQCGLVEGALMLIGALGKVHGLEDDAVVELCYNFAQAFESRFGSLLCRELRPEGFSPDNPPHLCEDLTRKAILFDIGFMIERLGMGRRRTMLADTPEDSLASNSGEVKLSHLDDEGRVRMVGVGHKPPTRRVAIARGEVRMKPETLRLIATGDAPKGDVLTTAQIAGIMAAKRTHELIPLCHPLPLTKIDVDFAIDQEASRIVITATARCTGQTGVEMEALTAVSVAALTIYDMAKAVEKTMRIGEIRLVRKTGGKNGEWRAEHGGR
jgi:cyclic pyranopterin phosphate synthase